MSLARLICGSELRASQPPLCPRHGLKLNGELYTMCVAGARPELAWLLVLLKHLHPHSVLALFAHY